MLLSETHKFIPVIESKDYGSAGIDGDSINMGLLHSVALHLLFGALTGNSVLKFYAGATAGTKTTALAFSYKLGSADYKAAAADGLGDLTAVASTGLTLTATTFDHRQVVVEFESEAMAADKPWLTIEIDNTASAMNVACSGIGVPRYAGQSSPTVISAA